MAATEVLGGGYPGIAVPPDAVPSPAIWGLKLLPASRSLLSPKSLLNDKAVVWALVTGLIIALSFLRPWYVKLPGGTSSLCLFHIITGIPCLLCGMTRSLAAAARLHIGESFNLHLLGPFLFLFLLLAFMGSLTLLVTGQRLELNIPVNVRNNLSWFVLALLVAAWVLKLVAFGANV